MTVGPLGTEVFVAEVEAEWRSQIPLTQPAEILVFRRAPRDFPQLRRRRLRFAAISHDAVPVVFAESCATRAIRRTARIPTYMSGSVRSFLTCKKKCQHAAAAIP